MAETTITFLGVGAHLPRPGQDTSSFVINRRLLVDCGWSVALRLELNGIDPTMLDTLYFTHCHPDHYMGLAGLLFWRGMAGRQQPDAPPLRIVGPPDDLPLVADLAQRYVQSERFLRGGPPLELHPLEPGAVYETDAFRIETVRSIHPVTGVCSRLIDQQTGAVIAFTGDTAPNPAFQPLAKNADLLIHEASLPPSHPEPGPRDGHSRAQDAAQVALKAGAKRLRLVHLYGGHENSSLAAARVIFPDAELGREGETLVLPMPG